MEAVLDVFRVLYEPGKVFERVKERPRVLVPFIVIAIILLAIQSQLLPFFMQGMAGQIAQAAQADPARGASMEKILPLTFVYFFPVIMLVILAISAGILWLCVSLFGGDAKYKPLMSISVFASITFALNQAVALLSLKMHPGVKISTPQDLNPPLGLDMLAPGGSHFVVAVLAGINVFAIWGVVLTAIGIETVLKTSRSTAYTVSILAFIVGLAIKGVFG